MAALPKAYSAGKIEDSIYAAWEASGFFAPKAGSPKVFSISMPPPNATGELHIGHAMFLTLQDIMIRYHRMKGDAALWLPGTDHASIATQNKVEKELLKSEGKTRHDLGREEFLQRVNQFVKDSQHTIRRQIRKMGSSCDWSRERYTLDDGLTRAVQEVFVRMYKDGMIYRGNRIVNWCPRCSSTLADDEVEYKEQTAKLYYIKYFLISKLKTQNCIVVATTRPETKLGDTAVAVHPKDKRYKHLVGKNFNVQLGKTAIQVKVIADECVDSKFGAGAIGVTPGHSFIDFEMSERHNLPVIQVISERGDILIEPYIGLSVACARQKIVEDLENAGLLEKVEEIKHNLSVCYRCATPIEPLVSKQWFIDVNSKLKTQNSKLRKIIGKDKTSLKEIAIAVVKKGEIKIIPDRFNKTYFHWMENLRDWCISRQIWFGHRIPVYYCVLCEHRKGNIHQCEDETKNRVGLFTKNAYGQLIPDISSIRRRVDEGSEKIIDTFEPIVGIDLKKCSKCGGELLQDPDTLDTWFSSGLWTFSTLGWPKKTSDLKRFHPTSVMETGYDILFFWVARMILMSAYALGEVPFKTVYLHGLVRDKLGRKMSKSLGNGIDPLDMIKKFGADAVRLSLVIGTTPGNDIRLYEEKIAGYRNFVNKVWNISRFVLTAKQSANSKLKTQNSKLSKDHKPKLTAYGLHLTALSSADHWILYELSELVKRVNRNLEHYRFSSAGEDIYEFMWHKLADIYIEETKREKLPHQQEILEYVLEKCLIILHPFVPFVTEYIWEKLKIQNSKLKTTTQNSKLLRNLLMIQPWIDTIDSTISKVKANEFIKARGTKKQPEFSSKERQELKKYITSLEARLANKQFLSKAPREVIEKEKARLKEARAKLG